MPLLFFAASNPAAAQFVCTATSTDINCQNSGTAPAPFTNSAAGANQNATTANSGSSSGITTDTSAGGNATTTNTGTNVGGIDTQTTAGGNATVINSGSNQNGITASATGGNATVVNSGSNTNGISAFATGGSASITNSGSNTNGLSASSTGGNTTITNSGGNTNGISGSSTGGNTTITNSGGNTNGIGATALGGNATVTNSGSNTSGMGATATGGNASVTNSGSNTDGIGVSATGGNGTVINSGSNTNGIGVTAIGGNALVINSGSNTNGIGVSATGGNGTVTNSGFTTGGVGVNATGGAATLNLLAGSIIIGTIDINGTSGRFVNFLSGNHNLTFVSLAGAVVGGREPFAVLGNQAAAVDPTPFAMLDRNLMDFSRTVSSAVPMADGQPGAAPALLSYADTSANDRVADVFANIPGASDYAADTAVFKAPTVTYRDGTVLWARGFAGERRQKADDGLLHNSNRFYGGMIGGEWGARGDLRLGAFIGGGHTNNTTDLTVGDTKSDLVFGGAYARYLWGNSFLDGLVQVGHSSNDTNRNINNNLLPGGLEFAKASYDGWYVSPELTYGFHHRLPSFDGAVYTLTPSVQVRYLYASFDGYSESGTTAPLTVGTRTLGDFEERGQLKLTRTISGRTETLATSVYGGILGVQRVGDSTIGAVLLGQSIPFATPGDDNAWAGFGGAEVALRTGNIAVYLAAEYYAFSDSSNVASARGGVRFAF